MIASLTACLLALESEGDAAKAAKERIKQQLLFSNSLLCTLELSEKACDRSIWAFRRNERWFEGTVPQFAYGALQISCGAANAWASTCGVGWPKSFAIVCRPWCTTPNCAPVDSRASESSPQIGTPSRVSVSSATGLTRAECAKVIVENLHTADGAEQEKSLLAKPKERLSFKTDTSPPAERKK
ncbi:hypothetical protein HPB51_002134 [Rhipicephalus microplus]|uniref:Uncharacterized protein n=1 Tax=Rhipicephalus microplus TaxID=6941 RepID=A0A9J6EQY6_RHIMP|nr:hypothetical protein HPB51_002134 [Rhipicephalus microplus]